MSKPKRKADIQLTKDDREADDSDEVIVDGAVPKASKEELSKRRIVRAKRPAAATVTAPKEAKEETKASASGGAFANVSLTSSSSSAGVFGASSAFAGFGAAVAKEGEKSVFGAAATGFKGFGTTTSNDKDGDTATAASSPAPAFGGFASFTSSSSNAKPFVFGQAPSDTSKSASGKPAVELPHDYKVQSGEESEICLHEVRCKSYRWGVPTVAAAASDVATEKAPPSVPHATTFDDEKSSETAEEKESKDDEKEQSPKETSIGDSPRIKERPMKQPRLQLLLLLLQKPQQHHLNPNHCPRSGLKPVSVRSVYWFPPMNKTDRTRLDDLSNAVNPTPRKSQPRSFAICNWARNLSSSWWEISMSKFPVPWLGNVSSS